MLALCVVAWRMASIQRMALLWPQSPGQVTLLGCFRRPLIPAEQQRLGMARLFFHRPRFAILDECTSGVTVEMEERFCDLLRQMQCTCITISHRPALMAFHDIVLALDGEGGWSLHQGQRLQGSPEAEVLPSNKQGRRRYASHIDVINFFYLDGCTDRLLLVAVGRESKQRSEEASATLLGMTTGVEKARGPELQQVVIACAPPPRTDQDAPIVPASALALKASYPSLSKRWKVHVDLLLR